jgi:hypothetical protein
MFFFGFDLVQSHKRPVDASTKISGCSSMGLSKNDYQKTNRKRSRDLPPEIDTSTIYRVTDERRAEISDILIDAGDKVRLALIAAPPTNARAGSVHHFSVFQSLGDHLVGGSTYALRVGELEVQRPATRVRVTLEKVQILDYHDPIFRGKGEFRFMFDDKKRPAGWQPPDWGVNLTCDENCELAP